MKSICIKTNNLNLIQYLQNEFNNIDLQEICFSCNQFKHYKNIIIHYTGNDNELFLNRICCILSLLVIDELEDSFFNKIIYHNYFYFESLEQKQIADFCHDININNYTEIFDKKFNSLYECFYTFLLDNKNLFLDGFINFRIKPYLNILNDLVLEAVNNYIVEKEYLEFLSLLRLYVNSQPNNINLVHIIYSNQESILLNENKEIIANSNEHFQSKYLSDISFSSNDYTLNSLLTLLPEKIFIHLLDGYIDEFINTLQAVFVNRVQICNDCNVCNIFKKNR